MEDNFKTDVEEHEGYKLEWPTSPTIDHERFGLLIQEWFADAEKVSFFNQCFISCLESKEYTQCINAMIVLDKISDTFPAGFELVDAAATLSETDERGDVKLMAGSLSVKFEKKAIKLGKVPFKRQKVSEMEDTPVQSPEDIDEMMTDDVAEANEVEESGEWKHPDGDATQDSIEETEIGEISEGLKEAESPVLKNSKEADSILQKKLLDKIRKIAEDQENEKATADSQVAQTTLENPDSHETVDNSATELNGNQENDRKPATSAEIKNEVEGRKEESSIVRPLFEIDTRGSYPVHANTPRNINPPNGEASLNIAKSPLKSETQKPDLGDNRSRENSEIEVNRNETATSSTRIGQRSISPKRNERSTSRQSPSVPKSPTKDNLPVSPRRDGGKSSSKISNHEIEREAKPMEIVPTIASLQAKSTRFDPPSNRVEPSDFKDSKGTVLTTAKMNSSKSPVAPEKSPGNSQPSRSVRRTDTRIIERDYERRQPDSRISNRNGDYQPRAADVRSSTRDSLNRGRSGYSDYRANDDKTNLSGQSRIRDTREPDTQRRHNDRDSAQRDISRGRERDYNRDNRDRPVTDNRDNRDRKLGNTRQDGRDERRNPRYDEPYKRSNDDRSGPPGKRQRY